MENFPRTYIFHLYLDFPQDSIFATKYLPNQLRASGRNSHLANYLLLRVINKLSVAVLIDGLPSLRFLEPRSDFHVYEHRFGLHKTLQTC